MLIAVFTETAPLDQTIRLLGEAGDDVAARGTSERWTWAAAADDLREWDRCASVGSPSPFDTSAARC
jgi:hypothetical protein